MLNVVRCPYVRGQLSSERRRNENDIIMRMGAASAVGMRHETREWRHDENDVIMIIAAYGNITIGDTWPRAATL